MLLVGLVGTACGSNDDSAGSTVADPGGAGHATGTEAISFGESLAQIRGHHRIALELYEGGDVAGAAVHAGHPIDEILTSVRSELEEHDGPAQELADSLLAVRDAVASKTDAGDVG